MTADPASGRATGGRCVVLNDHEREALREVERRLLSEDPDFAESFTARAQHLSDPSRAGVGIKAFLVAGLVVSALMLVIGSLGGAAAFATGTGCIWLAWRFGAAVTAGPVGDRSR
jgi:hypothetical protein